ncbi:MAG: hypothetical protein ABW069_20605 [Duganella sp.]
MTKWVTIMLCAVLACGSAGAADTVRHERIDVQQGDPARKTSGKITGYQTVEYTVHVPAGSKVDIGLKSANTSAYFNVTVAGAGEALFVGARDGNRFHTVAPADGQLQVLVYLMRNAARRNQAAAYVLEVGLTAPDKGQ